MGNEVGKKAFAQWLTLQGTTKGKADGNAAIIANALWPMVEHGRLAIPRGGYVIRRGRERLIVEAAGSYMAGIDGRLAGRETGKPDDASAGSDGYRWPAFPSWPAAQYRAVMRKPVSCAAREPAPDPDSSLVLSRRRASKESSSEPVSPDPALLTNRQPKL